MNSVVENRKMFVRYLGTKACWTVDDERFYIGDREELQEEERKLCDKGGGYLPLSVSVDAVAN